LKNYWNVDVYNGLALPIWTSETQVMIKRKVRSQIVRKCEVTIHTLENGTWESSGTAKNSELDYRGQNTLPWGALYTVRKVLKCRCPKWPRMSHLDICSTSYGRKKGRKSNWQFDSQPLKVGNRPDPSAWRQNATHHWKALKENYTFFLDLILIGGLSKELWVAKVPGVHTNAVSGQFRDSHLGVSGQKTIWMWPPWSGVEYIIWGKVVASLESGLWWVKWVQSCPWLVLAPRVLQNVN
jgi:hypothetical protein